MSKFQLVSEYSPAGDQPKAIDAMVNAFENGEQHQILLGVTGSGKTYTMANVIQKMNKPTLILTHNKTLAAQLYQEFKGFFPHNAVEYFISYYDYYQPEAYVVSTDTFIEKDAGINDEIEKLRLRATCNLITRDDVIVVASVSCIYGLGTPEEWKRLMITLKVGEEIERNEILRKLVDIQYTRNDYDPLRGTFRVRGEMIEVHPSYDDYLYRIELFGDEIEKLSRIDLMTGKTLEVLENISIAPAKQYVTGQENMDEVFKDVREMLNESLGNFRANGKLIEAQRLESRVLYDMDMLRETGFCSGIENYSSLIERRAPGTRPSTLIDFFPNKDWLLLIDESHVSIPQVNGMFNGDRARKTTLVEYGFRLPCALDNRPMKFAEFCEAMPKHVMYVSATPGNWELDLTGGAVVEQIIRPTGLLDPKIDIHSITGQIDYLVENITPVLERKERVLITTLTKKMAEDLTDFLSSMGFKVRYLHHDIKTLERSEILRDLRLGVYDILIGINLLREGLDLPEVSLVAIMDADKEGFLRSERSLIQIMGRGARNANGKVILFADRETDSMRKAISETVRRRKIQEEHNLIHNIVPTTTTRKMGDEIKMIDPLEREIHVETIAEKDIILTDSELEQQMQLAAQNLDFEEAARLRDELFKRKNKN